MIGIIIITITAFILSILLTLTNYFLTKKDKRIETILKMLPGYNCGACGFGGCPEMAVQILENNIKIERCKPISKQKLLEIKEYLNKIR